MGSNWLSIDNNFPTFTGNESLRDQVKLMHDFLPILIESLKYQLNNLDSSNWNTKAMKTFQSETTEELENALDNTDTELARLIYDLEKIDGRIVSIAGRMTDAEIDVSYLQVWKEEITAQVDGVEALLDALGQAVTVEEDGSVTLGGEGMTVHLAGTVYLNGTLLEA